MLLRAPRFTRTLAVRPSLALGRTLLVAMLVLVGAPVAAVVDATLLRPLTVPEPSRLARIFMLTPGVADPTRGTALHHLTFERFREAPGPFETIEGVSPRERALGGEGGPESVQTVSASAGVFRLLGATLAADASSTSAKQAPTRRSRLSATRSG